MSELSIIQSEREYYNYWDVTRLSEWTTGIPPRSRDSIHGSVPMCAHQSAVIVRSHWPFIRSRMEDWHAILSVPYSCDLSVCGNVVTSMTSLSTDRFHYVMADSLEWAEYQCKICWFNFCFQQCSQSEAVSLNVRWNQENDQDYPKKICYFCYFVMNKLPYAQIQTLCSGKSGFQQKQDKWSTTKARQMVFKKHL